MSSILDRGLIPGGIFNKQLRNELFFNMENPCKGRMCRPPIFVDTDSPRVTVVVDVTAMIRDGIALYLTPQDVVASQMKVAPGYITEVKNFASGKSFFHRANEINQLESMEDRRIRLRP